ncbi:MAG: hypothetical protein CVV03_10370 [Firmicutes bacterium HGW-Firmicutes-8]|nr:MAG: hypothetical protein CVV03_10370 [Firmicutes bacterium HGW-Firmicutes-8]
MKTVPSIQTVEATLKNELESVKDSMIKFIKVANENPQDMGTQILELKHFRSRSYESLNQIQHEWLLVNALKWLNLEHNIPLDGHNCNIIEWNPRQTGSGDEPDIRIINKETGLEINCEASTSETPIGVIDKRIDNHLKTLSKLNGTKYYFVLTQKMKQRAETKINKNGWDISVVLL